MQESKKLVQESISGGKILNRKSMPVKEILFLEKNKSSAFLHQFFWGLQSENCHLFGTSARKLLLSQERPKKCVQNVTFIFER